MLIWLTLAGRLAHCAWVPGREMQLAMWRARWSGVRHYGKLPFDYFLTGEDPFEFIDKDTPLENWQQACIYWDEKDEKERQGTTEGNGQKMDMSHKKERPWVDSSCDAYSLGLHSTCSFSRYVLRPWGGERTQAQLSEEADYIIVGDPYCFFQGPLPSREGPFPRFYPTPLASPHHRSIKPQLIHMMYRCPSTRPLAVWVCFKCSSTSMGTWLLRMENAALLRRVAHVLDVISATYSPADGGRTTSLALAKGIVEDFPGSITEEELANVGTLVRRQEVKDTWGNGTNVLDTGGGADVQVWMLRSYCTLCCAWGDGRMKILIARNPYVRLMSYYKMRMRDERTNWPSINAPQFKGWSDFRPWIYALLSHRERTGRFTSDSAAQFTDGWKKHCTQRGPIECGKNNTTNVHGTPCAMECTASFRPIVSWQDVLHAIPVVDSLLAAGYETHVRDGVFHVLHVESIEKDIKDIEERLCREYDDCEPLPEYPRAYPRRENNDKCHFNAKTRAFSNCIVSWEELWPPSLVDLVNLHYAEDFRLLGYKTTPFDVMPIRKDT